MRKLVIPAILSLVTLSTFGAAQKITCRVTGKKMDTCCCEQKNGKFYCKLTKQTYDECCCDMAKG